MKLELWTLGKSHQRFIDDGVAEYSKRISARIPFTLQVIQPPGRLKTADRLKVLEAEAKLVIDRIQSTDHLILLDEGGKSYTSLLFSKHLEQLMSSDSKRTVFLIGGAFGFHQEVRSRANGKMSLSGLTFSHLLARLIFCEQLYRALTIISGHPYHNE